ncbi:MAG: T9SS type A sorting domain-containing protein [Salinivirgaceae bacterium]|nr:T9SS type A sorting domain-containing protein [Salinivirgaceae bacterium]
MKRFAFVVSLLLISIISFSQITDSIGNLSFNTVTASSAILHGDVDNSSYALVYQHKVIIDDDSDFSSPLYNWVSATGDDFTIDYLATGLSSGVMYYYKFKATFFNGGTNPVKESISGSFTTLKGEPDGQATINDFSSVATTTLTANWTRGNGDSILVVAKKGAAVSSFPVDGTTYTANPTFGSGSQIGTGNFVLYDGTSTSVDVDNLLAGNTYHFRVFEYNNSVSNVDYLTTESINDTIMLSTEPTEQAHTIAFSSLNTTSMTIGWSGGNGSNTLVAVRETAQGTIEDPTDGTSYTVNNDWSAKEDALGESGYYLIYNGTGSSVSLTNLTVNTTYWVEIFEFNGSAGSQNYFTGDGSGNPASIATLAAAPTTQAHTLNLSDNVQSSSVLVKWTVGNGTRRICMASTSPSFPAASLLDGNDYSADFDNNFALAPANNGVKIVYDGTDDGTTGFTTTNLSPGTLYYFKVVEYNNTGSNTKYSDAIASVNPSSVTTLASEPTTQTTTITFDPIATTTMTINWSGGNGTNTLVTVRESTQGSITDPIDGSSYTASSNWTSKGSQLGISEYYVVYNGPNSTGAVELSNLSVNTTYWVEIFDFNGSSGTENYFTGSGGSGNPASTTTLAAAPTTQAHTLNLSDNVQSSSVLVKWMVGNGTRRICMASTSPSFPAAIDLDGNDYSASFDNDYTLAPTNSGVKIVYDGTDDGLTGFTTSGLNAGTLYYFKVVEYNNTGSNTKYSDVTASVNPSSITTLASEPTEQAHTIAFSSLNTTSMTIGWSGGNGSNTLVAVREAAQGTIEDPTDGTSYTVSNNWSTKGDQLGTSGYYVVYNSTGSSVSLTNLTVNTTYWVEIFEFNGSVGSQNYFTGDGFGNPASTTTLATAPTTQVSDITFGTTTISSIVVNWTGGDGENVIIVAKESGSINDVPSDGTDYDDDNTFNNGQDILGTGEFIVFDGARATGTVTVLGLSDNTEYFFRAFTYNNSGLNTKYLISSGAGTNPTSQTTLMTEPTEQAHTIAFTSVNTTSMTISWSGGNGTNSLVAVRQSTQGSIENPVDATSYTASNNWSTKGDQLGTSGYYVVYNSTGSSVSLTNLSANTTYWVEIFEFNGSLGSENYFTGVGLGNPANSTTLKLEPTTQSTNVAFSSLATTTFTTSWTRGNGDGIIVLAKSGSAVSDFPVDGTTYTADAVFEGGTQIGAGNYVLYIGSGTSENITALTTGTDYHVRTFEYNNSGTDINYMTASATGNPNNQSTLSGEPSTQASNIVFSSLQSNQVTLTWTNGQVGNRIVLAKQGASVDADPVDNTAYTANATFGTVETEIGTDNYVVYNGSSNTVTVTGLTQDTQYTFKVYEYSNSGVDSDYKIDGFVGNNPNTTTTILGPPTSQAAITLFDDYATDSYTVHWTRGDGDNILVVGKLGSTITDVPSDGGSYTASSVFGSGTDIGSGSRVVYDGPATSVDVTNLGTGSEYFFRVFEYNNTGDYTKFLTTSSIANDTTLAAEPTTAASSFSSTDVGSASINLLWTNGNGNNRIVVAREDGPISSEPVDAETYAASSIFGSGDLVGSNNYVVYNGTSNSVSVTGLKGSTTYYFKVYEYNSGKNNYLLTGAPSINRTTAAQDAPTTQASSINFTNIGTTTFTINWTNGNGARRIVALKAGSGTISNPEDNETYDASTVFGSGDQLIPGDLSGYYIVYNGSGTSVNVTGLSENIEYYAQVFEYNNADGNEAYYTATATDNPNSSFTLKPAPTGQAHTISFSNKKTNSMQVSWINGNGENRIVLVKQGAAVDANPQDNNAYTANSVYVLGDQIGTGNYVVYNGSGTSVTVTGLTQLTAYHFRVYEYNNTGSNTKYYTATASSNPNSTSTIGPATWIGGYSGFETDWGTGANWSIAQVPTGDYSVSIPDVTNDPIITGTETVDFLTIADGANVTISSGSLIVNNDLTIQSGAGTAYIDINSGTLTVSNDAVLQAGTYINIADGNSLSVSNDLTLGASADASPSGMIVIPGTGTLSVSGTSTLNRYINYNATHPQHLISFPTSPTSLTTFSGLVGDEWDETTPAWAPITGSTTISAMEGTSIWFTANKTLSFSGTFNTGSQSIGVTNTSAGDAYGWNLVGNPYPCTIDWEASGWTLTNVDATAYYYNSSSGGYTTWNRTTSTGDGSKYIAACQGFFVHASANGTIGTTNAVRASNSQDFRKSIDSEKQMVRLQAKKEGTTTNAFIVFYDGATDYFDSEFDAYKKFTNNENTAQIFSMPDENTALAIDTYNPDKLTYLSENDFSVNMGVRVLQDGEIIFSASEILNIPDNIYIYLFDNVTNTYTNLKSKSYYVYLNAGDYAFGYCLDRFSMIFTSNALSLDEDKNINDLLIYTYGKTIFIKTNEFNRTNSYIQTFDISGRVVDAKNTNNSALQKVYVSQPGTYILKIIFKDFTVTQKVVVR